MRLFLILFLILLNNTGCNRSHESNILEIDVNFSKNDNLPNEVISGVDYIPLETNDESLIGRISKILVTDERIYILDAMMSRALFVFDNHGNFLFKIKRIGKGPGEYTELNDFTLFQDKIILLAFKSVLFFNTDGKFLFSEEIETIADNIIVKSEAEVYLFQNYFLDRSNFVDKHIIKTNLKFTKTKKYFPPFKKEMHNYYRFQKDKDQILLSSPPLYSNVIYNVTNRNYYPFIQFNFINKNIPAEFQSHSIQNSDEIEYPIVRNIISKDEFIYFLVTYGNYYYIGLHFYKGDQTFIGKKIDGQTISNPVIYDINGSSLYTYMEAFYFLNPLYYNNDSDIDKHNTMVSKLKLKNEFDEESNPIIIRYNINNDYLK